MSYVGNASWPYYKEIAINASYIDINITSQPAFHFDPESDSDIVAHAKADFSDLRFEDSAGNELARWITPELDIYVQAPAAVDSATNTTVKVFYGNASASDYAPGDTYGQYNVHGNVDYLFTGQQNAPSASFATACEATGNFPGTALNLSGAKITSSAIPRKAVWDFRSATRGASSNRIELGTNGPDFSGGYPISISAWITIYPQTLSALAGAIYTDYEPTTGQRNFWFRYGYPSDRLEFYNWNSGNALSSAFSTVSHSGDPDGTSLFVAITIDASGNWTIYEDGASVSSGTISDYCYAGGGDYVGIGAVARSNVSHDEPLAGDLADLKVYESYERTAAEIKAEYHNAVETDFWIVGTEQSNGTPAPAFIPKIINY
jgi:hypothetical protein